MDDATQYWIFLTAVGDTVISQQEATAQRHFRPLLRSLLPNLASSTTFPHRDIQRYLVKQGRIQPAQGHPKPRPSAQPQYAPAPSVRPAPVTERVPVGAAPAMVQRHSGGSIASPTASPSITAVGLLSRPATPTDRAKPLNVSSPNVPSPAPIPLGPTVAELCLRCAISHQIDYACQQIADQFGTNHGFSRMVLVAAVLHDECLLAQQRSPRSPRQASAYRSLATEIVETFDPDRSSLRVWTVRRVRHDNTINTILLEHGVYFVSDWAILNDTNEAQLERILAEFYRLSQMEVQLAVLLLESYHTVYRGDRLQQRQTGRCPAPTPDQLQRIAQYWQTLQQEDGRTQLPTPSAPQTLQQLQALAHCLRDYRIHHRGGKQLTESIDDPNFDPKGTAMIAPSGESEESEDGNNDELMALYQQVVERSLDQAIQTVIEQRVATLRKRKGNRDQLFLKGLALFHGQGLTMTQIAPHLGYERQDKVSFLLKLKDLRADVRHALLQELRQQVGAIARQVANASQLEALDQRLDTFLNEEVTAITSEAERETSGTRHGPLTSRFARRLCHYLDLR
ncbi:MAG: hypothetical protein AB4042_17700 [Leptolyngbyaceae cyanobacterium]